MANNEIATVSIVNGANGTATAPPAQSPNTFLQLADMVASADGRTVFGVMLNKDIVITDVSSGTFRTADTGINNYATAKLAINAGGKLYVVDPTNDYFAVFTRQADGSYGGTDIRNIGGPSDVAVSADTSRVYVVNKLAGNVTVYNGSTNALVTTIPIGGAPDELEIDPTGKFLYVSDSTTRKVSIVRL